jgi:exopolysaccharide production protein ExoZ
MPSSKIAARSPKPLAACRAGSALSVEASQHPKFGGPCRAVRNPALKDGCARDGRFTRVQPRFQSPLASVIMYIALFGSAASSPPENTKMLEKSRINSIHFLRFIAATSVLVHHAITGYGSKINVFGAGVDVFFVISGVVIGMTMQTAERSIDFTLKRLIRVLPLYWIATLGYVGFKYFVYNEAPSQEAVLRSIFLIPKPGPAWGFIYWPGWSLAYEMLFYIVAAASLFICPSRARSVCFILFSSLAIARVSIPGHTGLTFETQMCLQFCFGIAISEMIRREMSADRVLGLLCLVLATYLFVENSRGSHMPRALAWGIPSALLVVGAMAFERSQWLRSKWVTIGGNASYAIYLSHITTFEVVQYVAARNSIPMASYVAISCVSLVVIALAVGVAFHLFVEQPLLDFLRSLLLPKRRLKRRQTSGDLVIKT